MRKWIVQTAVPILCGLALLLGVIALGRAARAALHDYGRYVVAFGEIDCEPPQGMLRSEFLAEVQTLTRQPQPLHLLDANVASRLRRAFAVHPWVESVRRVQIVRRDRNRAGLRIELAYRQPVLAVRVTNDAMQPAKVVDRRGVLLPMSAASSGLPMLTVESAAPAGEAGSRWGDHRVAAAAATAAFLNPHLTRLGLDNCAMELVGKEVVFHKPGVRVVWGRPPGCEMAGEAPARVKLRRLLDYQADHDGLESLEHDVRLIAYQGHFPLMLADQP